MPHPTSASRHPSKVPIIDFSSWTTPTSSDDIRKSVAEALVHSCHETGFVYIKNHGIPAEDLETAFSWIKKFFDLPAEQKDLAKHPDGSITFRGWQRVGVEKASKEVEDIDESYAIGHASNSHDPNIYLPDAHLPGFTSWSLAFYDQCWTLGRKVLRALSLGLGLEESHLLKYHSPIDHELAIRYYPPVPASQIDNKTAARLGAHTDFDSITLLFQDDCGGLEVEGKGEPGVFYPVEPIEDALVMNIGDVLMRWSNDYLTSTRHRVLLPPLQDRFTGPERMTRTRYSMPFFIAPRRDVLIDCLDGIGVDGKAEEKKAKYQPIYLGDFVDERARETFEIK